MERRFIPAGNKHRIKKVGWGQIVQALGGQAKGIPASLLKVCEPKRDRMQS